ncbi:MAG: hypothetical protein ACKO2Z_37095 [Sphaerospermopsis kisseleviana]
MRAGEQGSRGAGEQGEKDLYQSPVTSHQSLVPIPYSYEFFRYEGSEPVPNCQKYRSQKQLRCEKFIFPQVDPGTVSHF